MPTKDTMDATENELFEILAHPIRRQILLQIGELGWLTYTDLKDLGLPTGTLYHHLRILKPFLEQDEEKRYLLTEDGKNAVEKIQVILEVGKPKINLFRIPNFINKFFEFSAKKEILFSGTMSVLLIITILFGLEMRILLLGPFFLTNISNSFSAILIGITAWLYFLLVPYFVLIIFNEKITPFGTYLSRAQFVLVMPMFTLVINWVFFEILRIKVDIIEVSLLISQIATQIWCITFLSFALVSTIDIGFERSLLVCLFTAYLILLTILTL